MGILNMVYGSGGGGGYKSLAELKAMTLSDAITELNTDAPGYYNNLNGNGHIIGIGIANNDNTTYQCWGVSPIIYRNGAWRNGEIIIAKIKTDSSGILMIPKAGYGTGTSQNVTYNWWVSYDGGSETQYRGTGSAGMIPIASGLTADTEHTVVIRPNAENYLWARAFGFYNSGVQTLLTEIVYDSSYMGYAQSDTTTGGSFKSRQYTGCTALTRPTQENIPNTVTSIGNYYMQFQYQGCTNLVSTAIEVLPSTVTSIGGSYRRSQYKGCTSLTVSADEVMPDAVTSISTYFRYEQYQGCTNLTTTSQEVFSNLVTSIGTYFRAYQYQGCTSLTTTSQEVFSNLVTSIGTYFRAYQYQGCTSLTTASQETLSNTVTSIGNQFRYYQYQGCTSLTKAANEVFPASVTTIGNDFRSSQYKECSSLVTVPREELGNSVTTIGDYFRGYQYQFCTSLVESASESFSSSISSVGSQFRYGQYSGCTKIESIPLWLSSSIGGNGYRYQQYINCNTSKTVKVAGDVGYNANTNALSNTYVSVVLVPNAYLQNYISTTTQPRASITDSKYIGY